MSHEGTPTPAEYEAMIDEMAGENERLRETLRVVKGKTLHNRILRSLVLNRDGNAQLGDHAPDCPGCALDEIVDAALAETIYGG